MNPGAAPQLDLTVYKKEERTIVFQLLDEQTRAGIDLTTSTVRFTVRTSLSAVAPVILKETASGIVHSNQVTNPGEFTLTLTTGDTNLDVIEHVWDLWVDDEVYVVPSPFHVELSARQPGGVGDLSGLAFVDRAATSAVAPGSTTEEQTLGVFPYAGAITGVAVKLEDAVTAGTVTVNVKVEGITQLSVDLDLTDTTKNSEVDLTGTLAVAAGDEITVEIVTAGYDNSGSVVTALSTNVFISIDSAAAAGLSAAYERTVTSAVAEGTATTEQTAGILAFDSSVVGLAAKIEEPVVGGTVVVNLKVEGSTTLSLTLDTGNPESNLITAVPGTWAANAEDEISVEIVATGYDNAADVTAGITVNAMLSA